MRLYELLEKLNKYDGALIITTRNDDEWKTPEVKEVELHLSATPDYPKGRYLEINFK